MIKAVIFDVGGVIEKIDWHGVAADWEQRLDLEPASFLRLVFGGSDDGPLVGRVSAEEWWQGVLDRIGLPASDRESFFSSLEEAVVMDTRMLDFVKGLRTAVRTAFLTNSWSDYKVRFERHGLMDVVDHVLASSDLGVAKPDPGIYRAALDRLGAAPGETIFVDDSADNVEGARVLGMHAMLHRRRDDTIAAVRALLD